MKLNMMNIKRLLCLALCLCVLGSFPAFSEELAAEESLPVRRLEIGSRAQLMRFAERCRIDSYSKNLQVTLVCDIDLSGEDFPGIPIFCGSFDGKGHSISGFELSAEGSVNGFFRYLTDTATVRDLNLSGKVLPGGSRSTVGTLVGKNAGLISNCRVDTELDGADIVGGLAGENQVTGIVEKCIIYGRITGSHFIGGIAGKNLGVVRGCTNKADINTTPQQNLVDLTEITMDSLMGTEAVNTVTNVGGIAGESQGFIRDCVNRGSVGYRQMGYNVGGIAGSQSGYILNCRNYGDISGRKEVGGIVGQMEPSIFVAYEKDALQILQQQMDGLSAVVNQASSNAQIAGGYIGGGLSTLYTQMRETGQALNSLRNEQGGLDPDSFNAAQNVLNSGMAEMTGTMQELGAVVQTSMGRLSNDLYALQGQLNAMRATLGNISENIGGVLKDRSDEDTPEQTTGKLENCMNTGSVSGDLNVGGIAGAIAPENDFDISSDFVEGENNSLNFVSEIRAVILSCRNSGDVSLKHNSGGGIVGTMFFGLVKNSSSACRVLGGDADHVGGIAGSSKGFVRLSSVKGSVEGSEYVGGIAGEAVTVSDCRSMVELRGSERVGAVLGYGEQTMDESGQPKLSGNIYLCLDRDPGGIDGVSYDTVAQPAEKKSFFALPELSPIFEKVNISFVQENGEVTVVTIATGGSVPEEMIPAPVEKPGHLCRWDGFENVCYDFDRSFNVLYTPLSSTLESSEKDSNGLPLLLAEGSFLPDSSLSLTTLASAPALEDDQRLIVAAGYESSDGGVAHTLRYRVGTDEDNVKAYVLTKDGVWTEQPCTLLGSYAALELPEGAVGFALVREELPAWVYAAAAGGGTLLVVLFTALILTRRRRFRRQMQRAAH